MSRIDAIRARLNAYSVPGGGTFESYDDMMNHAPEDIAYLLDEIKRLRGELLEVRALLVGEHKMKSHLEAAARPPCWYEYEGRNYLLRTPCPTCRKVLGGGG